MGDDDIVTGARLRQSPHWTVPFGPDAVATIVTDDIVIQPDRVGVRIFSLEVQDHSVGDAVFDQVAVDISRNRLKI